MIKLEKTEIYGFEPAIRGMRNPFNSWAKSDSFRGVHADEWEFEPGYCIGEADKSLMMSLAHGGSTHAKYRRMIVVYVDITAPSYWWAEFDTYKIGTVRNSCSFMHKGTSKPFELIDFSFQPEVLDTDDYKLSNMLKITYTQVLATLNRLRDVYLETKDFRIFQEIRRLLPSGYNIRATIMLNYEVLTAIYYDRHNHKLDEWRELCKWIEELPYSEVITCD